jgi:hypothetical protein
MINIKVNQDLLKKTHEIIKKNYNFMCFLEKVRNTKKINVSVEYENTLFGEIKIIKTPYMYCFDNVETCYDLLHDVFKCNSTSYIQDPSGIAFTLTYWPYGLNNKSISYTAYDEYSQPMLILEAIVYVLLIIEDIGPDQFLQTQG